MKDITCRKMVPGDAFAMAVLLTAGDDTYGRYFTPFDMDEASLARRLAVARQDGYWGIWLAAKLIGFFMLRGMDAGYRRPSYGVYISQAYAGRGLSHLSLRYCMSWCRLNGVKAMMLKVHPGNRYARQVYEKHHFVEIGICPQSRHLMMEYRWEERQ